MIRTDASIHIGTGHLMRCLALAQAWKDAGGQVTFITACQNEDLLQQLREEEFDIHVLDHPYPDSSDWDYAKDILAAYPNAWVVLDGYHFDEVYHQWVKEMGHRLLVVDDIAHLKHYYSDIVLNQNLHAEQLQYSCEPYTRLLLGTHYVLLRREFLAWKNWKHEIPRVARRVLVTLGGGDAENYTIKVIQTLQRVDVPGLEATVVIGASNPHTEVLEAAASQSHIPIHLIHNERNMPELMAWADVAISSGGITCWELAYMGVPMLVTVWALNQEANARVLEENGIALAVKLEHTRNRAKKMNELLHKLLANKEFSILMSRMGRTIVDGQGTQRVLGCLRDRNRP